MATIIQDSTSAQIRVTRKKRILWTQYLMIALACVELGKWLDTWVYLILLGIK